MEDLRITAKRLGIITLAVYCPCCLWWLLRLAFKPPFATFGGAIFTDLEQIQKALVGQYLEDGAGLPDQFAPFCDVKSRIEYPRHWSKFSYRHKSGVILYGAPDDIFKLSDESLCVVDHKSAHNKGDEDPFLPQYKIQDIGYSNIAEVGLKLGTCSRGGIWYWEIQRDDVIANPKRFVRNGSICPPFTLKPVEVEIDYALLDPLLKELKKVWAATTPSDCREDCEECPKREAIFALNDSIVRAQQDRLLSAGASAEQIARSYYSSRHSWYSALTDIAAEMPEVAFSTTGMAAAWYL